MITESDFVALRYTPDLTEAGIAFACQSLASNYETAGRSLPSRLRRVAAGVAVELAFRRHLSWQNIPFEVKSAVPFTDQGHYDVSLGGRRCCIRSFLISYPDQIESLHVNLRLALEAPALVPLDQFAADVQSARDLYIFAFCTGWIAAEEESLKDSKIMQPIHLIHPMPKAWAHPRVWMPLGPLALKSELDQVLQLEIGGQDSRGEFLTRSLDLPAHTRFPLEDDFYSVGYLSTKFKPGGRLGLRSAARGETHVIEVGQWTDVWIHGVDIYLVGWITREEFRQRATLIPAGKRVFQFRQTRTRNLAVSMSELKPLSQLLARIGARHSPG